MPLPNRRGFKGIYMYLRYGQKLHKNTIENLKCARLTIALMAVAVALDKFQRRNMGPPPVSKLELEDIELPPQEPRRQ